MFFFNVTPTTEIYTLSLHDALPISDRDGADPAAASRAGRTHPDPHHPPAAAASARQAHHPAREDRKSTRLNSSHSQISYAVFCLKKKKLPRRRAVVPTGKQQDRDRR